MVNRQDLELIDRGLRAASKILVDFSKTGFSINEKSPGDPVTEADLAVDSALKSLLPHGDDGWLSEESPDDSSRLNRHRVWIVDPLDGTREFVKGNPEWSVSIGLCVDGVALAGGICNPIRKETILGGVGLGVQFNGTACRVTSRTRLAGARILASRSEIRRGRWAGYENAGLQVVPMGSVAYKLGLVSAGRYDGTWTLSNKSEWDVAAGAALIQAAGGTVVLPDGTAPVFNQPNPQIPGLLAGPSALIREVLTLLSA